VRKLNSPKEKINTELLIIIVKMIIKEMATSMQHKGTWEKEIDDSGT